MNTINLKTVNLSYFLSEMEKGQPTPICACYFGISCTLCKTQMLVCIRVWFILQRCTCRCFSNEMVIWTGLTLTHPEAVNLVMGCNEPAAVLLRVQSHSWELHMSLWHPLRQHKVNRYGKYEDISVWSGRWLQVPLGRSYKLSSKKYFLVTDYNHNVSQDIQYNGFYVC